QPPVDELDWAPWEQQGVEQSLSGAIVGSAITVRERLENFIERIKPDEILATAQIFDHAARVHSFEIVAEVREQLFAK
ncbi:MAG: LLM class flavin-dependent oxidoreductase, partial [Chthoniobacterales bacterium]